MTDRFYVSLTATCDEAALPDVLADMQSAMRDLAAASSSLSGLSLSFSRDDGDEFETVPPDTSPPAPIVPDPPTGPVVSTGPGTAPPDAVTADAPPTMGGAGGPLPPASDAGQHAAPTSEPTA